MSLSAVTLTPDPKSPKPQAATADLAERVPLPWLVLRVFWIAVRLMLAYWLAWQALPFFYQRF
jgi:hypothetical protein